MTTDERDGVLAEVRALLAQVREALKPPEIIQTGWAAPKGEVAENLRAMARRFAEDASDPGPVLLGTLPQRWAVWGVAATLDRLAYLLGLSEQERAFVAHAAEHPTDFASLEVYADWLEEQGRPEGAEVVRRLTPRTGDVLVFYHPPVTAEARAELERGARLIADSLRALGREVVTVLMPSEMDVQLLTVEDGDVVIVSHPNSEAGRMEAELAQTALQVPLTGRAYVVTAPNVIALEHLHAGVLDAIGLVRKADHERALNALAAMLDGEPEGSEVSTLTSQQVLKMIARLKRERQTVEEAVAAEREACAALAGELARIAGGSPVMVEQVVERIWALREAPGSLPPPG